MSSPVEIQFALRARPPVREASMEFQRPQRVTSAMAMAVYFEHLVESGEAKDFASVARMHGLSRERISQIIQLNFLAPSIQVEILYLPQVAGRNPISEAAVRKIANLMSWSDQKVAWAGLKNQHGLAGEPC